MDTSPQKILIVDDEINRIIGLELGADDYLPKPFNPLKLSAACAPCYGVDRLSCHRQSDPRRPIDAISAMTRQFMDFVRPDDDAASMDIELDA